MCLRRRLARSAGVLSIFGSISKLFLHQAAYEHSHRCSAGHPTGAAREDLGDQPDFGLRQRIGDLDSGIVFRPQGINL